MVVADDKVQRREGGNGFRPPKEIIGALGEYSMFHQLGPTGSFLPAIIRPWKDGSQRHRNQMNDTNYWLVKRKEKRHFSPHQE